MTTYVLGGGCFWCLDAVYRRVRGSTSVESGYAGGQGPVTYEEVATGKTGYAEVVRITFDETLIPPEKILDIFFLVHNPTTPNRQGADVGPQYRSVMFYANDEQKTAFQSAVQRAEALWTDPIVTEITPLSGYQAAEAYHQDYFRKNPESGYCTVVIAPKIIKAKKAYAKWFKEDS